MEASLGKSRERRATETSPPQLLANRWRFGSRSSVTVVATHMSESLIDEMWTDFSFQKEDAHGRLR